MSHKRRIETMKINRQVARSGAMIFSFSPCSLVWFSGRFYEEFSISHCDARKLRKSAAIVAQPAEVAPLSQLVPCPSHATSAGCATFSEEPSCRERRSDTMKIGDERSATCQGSATFITRHMTEPRNPDMLRYFFEEN